MVGLEAAGKDVDVGSFEEFGGECVAQTAGRDTGNEDVDWQFAGHGFCGCLGR